MLCNDKNYSQENVTDGIIVHSERWKSLIEVRCDFGEIEHDSVGIVQNKMLVRLRSLCTGCVQANHIGVQIIEVVIYV